MKEMIHTTHYVTLKIDVIKIILLLTAASALVEISMATTVAKDNKGGYIALMTDAQQLSEAAMQLEQQQQQQLPVEPFNFANLRRLHLKYKNGQSYANRRQGQQQVEAQQLRKEQQRQQQQPQRQKQQQLQQMLEQQELQQRLQQQQPRKQQWQQISRYNNKEQRDQDNNDVDDSDSDNDNENDNNSRSAERESGVESRNNDKNDNGYLYYRYLYSDDNNNNNKQPNGNGNPKRDDDDDDDDDDNYDYQEQQNRQGGRNSFRLQLSGANEPFRSTTSNKNNNNNGNKNHNNNINEIHNNSDNNNIDADDDNNDEDTVTKANNKSFSNHPDQDSDMLSFGDVKFYDDLEVSLPYGIQNVKRVPQRNVNHVGKTTTFQSLCPTKRVSIPLDTSAYEYRPNHYIEVTCAHAYPPTENIEGPNKNRICSEAGFSCVQLNRTIHLIRRNKAAISFRSSADCWESEVRIVSSGCECMWPKHHYGDIVTYHHQEQKRHQLAWGELGYVKENEDYAEIPINRDALKMIPEKNNIFTMPLN